MTGATINPRLWACALLLLAASCAQLKPDGDATPKAAAPQITEALLRDRAKEQLATGIKQYEAGDYDNAMKSLAASLDHGLLSKTEQGSISTTMLTMSGFSSSTICGGVNVFPPSVERTT